MATFAPVPAPATPAPIAAGGALAISSLVLGVVSIALGWTFLAPIAGLVVGILALGREPHNRTMAIWGIVLNAVVLAGVLLLSLLAVAFGLALLPFAFLL